MLRPWSDRSQFRGRRCNRELGNRLGVGADLQQGFGMPAAGSDICVQTGPALNDNEGVDRDGLGVRLRHYRLPLATPAIALVPFVCATCDAYLGRETDFIR